MVHVMSLAAAISAAISGHSCASVTECLWGVVQGHKFWITLSIYVIMAVWVTLVMNWITLVINSITLVINHKISVRPFG